MLQLNDREFEFVSNELTMTLECLGDSLQMRENQGVDGYKVGEYTDWARRQDDLFELQDELSAGENFLCFHSLGFLYRVVEEALNVGQQFLTEDYDEAEKELIKLDNTMLENLLLRVEQEYEADFQEYAIPLKRR